MKTSPLTRPRKAIFPARGAAAARVALLVGLGLVVVSARSQVGLTRPGVDPVSPRNIPTFFSISRQFVVRGIPASQAYIRSPVSVTNANLVRLEPQFVPASCERIKHALLDELGLNDQWRGEIFIDLHRAMRPDEPIVIEPAMGGNYHAELPDAFNQERLVPAIVEVLLLEILNRNADHYVEVPPWLALGLAAEVTFNSEVNSQMDLVISAPGHHDVAQRAQGTWTGLAVARKARSVQRSDLIKAYREAQPAYQPLTLRQLTWPEPEQLQGGAGEAYRDSAQLFVHELLALPDGRELFRRFLAEMPGHLNWQFSLFQAFHAHFANQRELEKWWALRVVKTTGRDLDETWPGDESWRKLDEVLKTPVEIRTDKAELPMHAELGLQAVFEKLDFRQRQGVLRQKIRALDWLRTRVSPDAVALIGEYRGIFDTYLRDCETANKALTGKSNARPALDRIGQDAVRDLERLDRQYYQLRPKPALPGTQTASMGKSP